MIINKIRKLQRNILDAVVRRHPALGLDLRAEGFVRLFERYLDPGSTVLDVGGGWGFYHEPLARRGHRTVVLDVVRPGYQRAPVVVYDGKRIPFPDSSFDACLLITVLHHIRDQEGVVRECRRVSRRYVIVVEDLYRHGAGRLWTILRDQIFNFEFFGHPKNFRTREDWIRFFSGEGFRLSASSEVYTWLSGLRILNGVLIFEKQPDETGKGGDHES